MSQNWPLRPSRISEAGGSRRKCPRCAEWAGMREGGYEGGRKDMKVVRRAGGYEGVGRAGGRV